jgi:hypothetical protein
MLRVTERSVKPVAGRAVGRAHRPAPVVIYGLNVIVSVTQLPFNPVCEHNVRVALSL